MLHNDKERHKFVSEQSGEGLVRPVPKWLKEILTGQREFRNSHRQALFSF